MVIRAIKKTLLRIAFGSIVRKKRESLGISQEKLAELSELNANYMGCIERGERNVGIDTIYKIAKGLQTNAKNLMPDIMTLEEKPECLEEEN